MSGVSRTPLHSSDSTPEHVADTTTAPSPGEAQQDTTMDPSLGPQQQQMGDPYDNGMMEYHEDPLLIAQTLTYITDDGSVVLSFSSAPFSYGFKARFFVLETIFILLLVAAVPIGAHGTVVSVSVGNLIAVAWFWYNSVRSVDLTSDGGLRFWIGNVEMDIPFDKIVSMRRVAVTSPCSIVSFPLFPHRGFLTSPTDGVAITTSVPSTPFFMWPRSAGRPERTCCFGALGCPRLTIVFSPAGGGLNFIREVENEMRSFSSGGCSTGNKSQERQQPPSYPSNQQPQPQHPGLGGGGVRPGGVSGDFFDV